MSNLLHHKDKDDGDGSSSGKGNVNAVRDVPARGTAGNMVVIDRSVPDWVVLSKGQPMLVGYQYGKVQMNVGSTKVYARMIATVITFIIMLAIRQCIVLF